MTGIPQNGQKSLIFIVVPSMCPHTLITRSVTGTEIEIINFAMGSLTFQNRLLMTLIPSQI